MKNRIISLLLLFALLLLSVSTTTYVTAAPTGTVQVAVSPYHTATIHADGTLWMAGGNYHGQLGIGVGADPDSDTSGMTPVKVLDNVISVAVSLGSTAAVTSDGTLYIWGCYNVHGLPGTSSKTYRIPTPTKLLAGVKAVSGGGASLLFLKTDGSVWALRDNNDFAGEYKPTQILTGVAQIATGGGCAAAVGTDGSLWVWGNVTPYRNLIASQTYNYIRTPQKIVASGVKSVALSSMTMAVIKTDGTLCVSGQVGDTSYAASQLTEVLSGVASVSVADGCVMAVRTNNTLWGWGYNRFGQVGTGTWTTVNTPTKVMSNVKFVSACDPYTVAVKTDNTIWGMGAHISGVYVSKYDVENVENTLGYFSSVVPTQLK